VKKATFFILLIFISEIWTVGSEDIKKNCVCVPHSVFCPNVPSSKLGYYATAAACLAPLGLVALSAPLLAFAGFTAGGIAGGSAGAWLMSLYGGNVAAGSLVAILQSWGAAGVGASAWAGAGGILATCLAIFFPKLFKKYSVKCEGSTDFVCFFDENYTGTGGFGEDGKPGKLSERYPYGKKVSVMEMFGLHDECDVQVNPDDKSSNEKTGDGAPEPGTSAAGAEAGKIGGAAATSN